MPYVSFRDVKRHLLTGKSVRIAYYFYFVGNAESFDFWTPTNTLQFLTI